MKTEAGGFLTLRQVLNHLYTELFGDILKQYDMTQMEVNILLFLVNNPQYDTAAQLVNACKLSKSQVSLSVEKLAKRGYLQRRLEGRRSHLSVLPKAEELIRDGRQRQILFRNAILNGISEEEMEQLNRLLKKMVDNARAAENSLLEKREESGNS